MTSNDNVKKKKTRRRKKKHLKKGRKKKTIRRKKGRKKKIIRRKTAAAKQPVNVNVSVDGKQSKSIVKRRVGEGQGSLDILKTSSEALGRVRNEFARARKEDAERYAKLKQEVERERAHRKWTDSKSGFRMSAPSSYPVPPSYNPIGTMIPSTILTEIAKSRIGATSRPRNTPQNTPQNTPPPLETNRSSYELNNMALFYRAEQQFNNIHNRLDNLSISQQPRITEMNDTISEATDNHVPSSIADSNDSVEDLDNSMPNVGFAQGDVGLAQRDVGSDVDDINDFESANETVEHESTDSDKTPKINSDSGHVTSDTVIDNSASDSGLPTFGALPPVSPKEVMSTVEQNFKTSDLNVFTRLTGFDSIEAAEGHEITKLMMSKVIDRKLYDYEPRGTVLENKTPLEQARVLTAALITGDKSYKYRNGTFDTPPIGIGTGILSAIFPQGVNKSQVKPTPMKTRSKGKKKRTEPVRTIDDVGSSGVDLNEALQGIMTSTANEQNHDDITGKQMTRKRTKRKTPSAKPTSKTGKKIKVRRRKPK